MEKRSPPVDSPQRQVKRTFDILVDLRLNNGWVNSREAGDFRHYRAHYDVIVMHNRYVVSYSLHAKYTIEKNILVNSSSVKDKWGIHASISD